MYRFWGKVRHHNGRGKALGFPTANINLSKKIPEGIYLSTVKLGEKILNALTFVGIAKTFNEKKAMAESYILDFDSPRGEAGQDIYGEWITVTLIKKIRDNKKFDSKEKLIEQMKKDEKEAKKYFSSDTFGRKSITKLAR